MKEKLGVALAVFIFAALKAVYSFPRLSDASVYLYMAKQITLGAVPYRDFFYSSPPLLPYLVAAYGSIFGFTWQAANWLPIILSGLDAIMLFAIGRRLYSRWAGLTAACFYLSSYVVLATTDFMSDVHFVASLLLASFLLLTWRKPSLAGAALAAAVLVKLYAIVLLPAFILILLFQKRYRASMWFTATALAMIFSVGAVFYAWVGWAFFDQVIVSHIGKIPGISKLAIATFFVRHDFLLLAALLPAVYGYVVFNRRPAVWLLLPLACLAIFYAPFSDTYYLYWKLAAAWLSLWAASHVRYFHPAIVAIFLVATAAYTTSRYVPEQAQAAVITQYEELVAAVKAKPFGPLYGDFEVTPLIALAAGRPIFKNYIDTNHKFFLNNYLSYADRAQEVINHRVPLILTKALLTPSGQIQEGPERVAPLSFFADHCRPDKVLPLERDYSHNALILWQCFP